MQRQTTGEPYIFEKAVKSEGLRFSAERASGVPVALREKSVLRENVREYGGTGEGRILDYGL